MNKISHILASPQKIATHKTFIILFVIHVSCSKMPNYLKIPKVILTRPLVRKEPIFLIFQSKMVLRKTRTSKTFSKEKEVMPQMQERKKKILEDTVGL